MNPLSTSTCRNAAQPQRTLPQAPSCQGCCGDCATLNAGQEVPNDKRLRDFALSQAAPTSAPTEAEKSAAESKEYYRLLDIERAKPDWDTSQARQAWLHWG